MIGLAEQIDGETATLREALVHPAPERKEDRQERWVKRCHDAGAGCCRMWLPINHRDHDGDTARNLTRGSAENLPRVLRRLSHSIHHPATRSSRPTVREPFAPHRLVSSPG